ncbi:hypothetical protein, variant [Sphaeroforma arctica JP610]|nr:hypothetical protein, variant [Sphaeroforma arctica JP610]KNC79777.1 hypothetical protein, variant [Sphaeroforma arctica JP610]|eukprot:XP_014153679.1 hypothetical protein, variant [Sphaeroforma arctica JP610]
MSGFKADDIEDLGFDRKEMYSENLSGGVALYHRHVFLIWGTAESWPSKVELMAGPSSDLSRAIGVLSKRTGLITKFTLCEADPSIGDQEGDLLVYPERKRFRGVDADEFVNNILANAEFGSGTDVHTSDIFVCAHAKRDMRCGKCGPELVDAIRTCASDHRTRTAIQNASKNSTQPDRHDVGVAVRGCSHVGGHKYAGNLIVYGSDKLSVEEQKEGDWYGYICPKDASTIVQRAVGLETNEPLVKLWRGRLGMGKQPHKLMVEQKIAEYAEARNPSPKRHFMNMFGFNAAAPAAAALAVAALVAAMR